MPALRRITGFARARVRRFFPPLSITPLLLCSGGCSADRFSTTNAEATSAEGERTSSSDQERTRSTSEGLDTLADAASSSVSTAETTSQSGATYSEPTLLNDAGTGHHSSSPSASESETSALASSRNGSVDGTTTRTTSMGPLSSETATHDSLDDAGLDASVSVLDAAVAWDASPYAASYSQASSSPDNTTHSLTDSNVDLTSLDGAVTGPVSDSSSPVLVCTSTRTLHGTVRDFSDAHPDMDPCDDPGVECRSEKGLLEPTLGRDGKPRLANERREGSSVKDATTFSQWFNDVPGVNVPQPFDLGITVKRYRAPRVIGYDSSNPPAGSPPGFDVEPKGFFPIDDQNDSGLVHNYHFTYEVGTAVSYDGGETLTVRGDDDIFVFLNRHLVIDLGGIHGTEEATIRFDDLAEEVGLVPGNVYDFRLFFAERHVDQSNLTLTTTAEFMNCR